MATVISLSLVVLIEYSKGYSKLMQEIEGDR